MRPIHLTLSAFGSYGGVEEISFEKRQGLFLIAGDTGSGKSTIFDGILFALYGKLNGKDREGKMMRSEYADDKTDTWVEFTFSYRDQEREKQYKIRRSPAYKRMSKRRDSQGNYKEVHQDGTVCLTLPDGRELTKKQEISEKIEEIIGLTSDQFSKIAMIAQGEFQELIMDHTGKRKEIFQRIFETQIYEQIEWEIWNRFKAEEEKRRQTAEQMKTILEGVILPDCSDFAGKTFAEAADLTEEWEGALAKMDTEPELLEKLFDRLLSAQKREQAEKSEECGKIAEIIEAGRRYGESKRELVSLAARKEELAAGLAEREKGALAAKESLAVFQEKNGSAGEEAKHQIYKIREQLPEYEKREAEEQNLQGLIQNEAVQKQKIADLKRLLEEQNKEKAELEQRGVEEEDAKLERERLNHEQEKLSKREEIWKMGETELPAVRELGKRRKEVQKACLRRIEQYEACRREREDIDRRYIAGQAGLLAGQLTEGEPCPVCGSREHPSPCSVGEDQMVRQEDREAAKRKERDAEAARDRAAKEAEDLNREYLLREKMLLQRMSQEISGFSIDRGQEALDRMGLGLREEKKSLEERLRGCERKLEEQAKRRARRMELEKLLLETAEGQKKAELAYQETVGKRQASEEKCAAWDERLTYPSLLDAKKELSMWEKKKADWEDERDRLVKTAEVMQKEADALRGKWEENRRNEEERRVLAAEQDAAFRKKFAASGYEEDGHEWDGDWEGMKKYLHSIQKEKTAELEQVKFGYEGNRNIYKKWKERLASQQANQKRYRILKSLRDAVRGNMSFQTYIQRQYFKQILQAANKRLSVMNRNQFLLVCRSDADLSGRGEKGLELDVVQPLTGKTRDAHTLSGGETFLASLAMALGLADVVQSRAGGTRLETMFIDEGFGSLSDEVRDMAVRVLLELADKNRLVGVISHVTELKEQIPDKLVVTKDSRGSHVRWETDR